MENQEFALRLLIALLLGAGLGLERQWRQRMAGLLTNSLVCVGSALFVSLSDLVDGDSSPNRIAAQVVSGIGFLAGGVILREGLNVHGLNTAATLWCAAAIGSLTGAGFISQGFIGAIAVLICHTFLTPLGDLINKQPLEYTEVELIYYCKFICSEHSEIPVRSLLLKHLKGTNFRLECLLSRNLDSKEKTVEIKAEIMTKKRDDQLMENIINKIISHSPLKEASWQVKESHFKDK